MSLKEEQHPPKYAIGQPLWWNGVCGSGCQVRPVDNARLYSARFGETWMYKCLSEHGYELNAFEGSLQTLPGLKYSGRKYLKVIK